MPALYSHWLLHREHLVQLLHFIVYTFFLIYTQHTDALALSCKGGKFTVKPVAFVIDDNVESNSSKDLQTLHYIICMSDSKHGFITQTDTLGQLVEYSGSTCLWKKGWEIV